MTQNLDRYHRQYLFKPIGEAGQVKICASRVTVIGCGALGSVIASTLARAGVGFIRIVDRDFIELNNLQRQVLFDEKDIAEKIPKAIASANKLKKINSQIEIDSVVSDVNFTNIESLIQDVDLVMDGTDNFETRFLINEACVKLEKPWIYAACIGSNGLTMNIFPKKTACLKCVFESAPPPELSPTCDTAGILGPAAMTIASFASTEAIKFLSGNIEALSKTLFSINLWTREVKSFRLEGLRERADCKCCKRGEFEYLKGEQAARTTTLCGRNAVQISRSDKIKLDLKHLAEKLEKLGKVTHNRFMLQATIDSYFLTVFPDGRAIINGTNDISKAKTVYSKFIGV